MSLLYAPVPVLLQLPHLRADMMSRSTAAPARLNTLGRRPGAGLG